MGLPFSFSSLSGVRVVKSLGRAIGSVEPSDFDGDGDGFLTGPDGRDNIPAPKNVVGRLLPGRGSFSGLRKFGVDSVFMPDSGFVAVVDALRRGGDGKPVFKLSDESFGVLRNSADYAKWRKDLSSLYSGVSDADVLISRHIDGFVKTYVNRSAFLDVFPEKAKGPLESFNKQVSDNPLVVNIKPDSLLSVLRSGSFKSSADVDSSRRFTEASFFGVPFDAPASQRPVYGSIDDPANPFPNASVYGGVRVVLKDDVKARTTFVPQDSNGAGVHEISSPVGSPSPFSSTLNGKGYDAYVETQIFGGVSVDDISEILLPHTKNADLYKDLTDMLDSKKIKWSIKKDPLDIKSVLGVRII